MDQQAQYPEEFPVDPTADENNLEEEVDYIVAPPLESAFGRYLREFRLLNSLLVSLFAVTLFLILMWGFVVYVAGGGEGKEPKSIGANGMIDYGSGAEKCEGKGGNGGECFTCGQT